MSKVAMIVFILSCLSIVTQAAPLVTLDPTNDITQPPPPIEFAAWTEVYNENDGVQEFRATFHSAIETNHPENNEVPLIAILPKSATKPVPTAILLHYWGASDVSAERRLALVLARHGVASVIMEMPYHLHRAPAGTKSGELAISADPDELINTMRQALLDLRRTVDWVQSHAEFDGQHIALVGSSLGGVVGSLGFAIEPRFSAFCSIMGGADITNIIWKSSRLGTLRELLRRRGYLEDSLRKKLAIIEPTQYLSPSDPRPSYVIAARYDTVVPRGSTDALLGALANKQVLWLDSGHYGAFFVESSVLDTAANFVSKVLAGGLFKAPSRLYAPTVRISAIYNFKTGLNVGVGLDIWKSNASGSIFGTAIFTPRGVEGFIGPRLSNGLAAGIVILPRRTTLGVFWSFVL